MGMKYKLVTKVAEQQAEALLRYQHGEHAWDFRDASVPGCSILEFWVETTDDDPRGVEECPLLRLEQVEC